MAYAVFGAFRDFRRDRRGPAADPDGGLPCQPCAVRSSAPSAGHHREPRVSVSRSIFPVVSDVDRAYFGRETNSRDQVGQLDGGTARFGKTYAGEPDQLVTDLAEDEAIAAADTLLLTIPNQLGVDYNAHLLDSVLRYVAPELGWR